MDKEDYKYKGWFISQIRVKDKKKPYAELLKWSVWGLGIYETMALAHQAVDQAILDKITINEKIYKQEREP